MKVINPTENDITVQVSGVTYTVEADGELSNVPAEHAAHWKNSLHNFIKIVEDVKTPVVDKKEDKKEDKKDEKKEEVKEEKKEEKKEEPKKKSTNKVK